MKNINFMNVLLLLIILVLCGLLFSTCNNKKKAVQSYQNAITLKEQFIKKYKDDSGRLHSTEIAQIASYNVIKSLYNKTIDSTAKVLKIKDNRIQELLQASIVVKNNGTGKSMFETKYIHDTITGKIDTLIYPLDVNDNNLIFHADIFKDGTNNWNYTYQDTLNSVTYIKKYGFLNLKSETILDISMGNKNSKIEGIKQFKISELQKQKHFSIGPYLGIQYNGQPSIGVGIQYNLIKF